MLAHRLDCPAILGLNEVCICGTALRHIVQKEGPMDAPKTVEAPSPQDAVNHPRHYTSNPSGVECIEVTEHMNFNVGNAVKYLWRADEKGDPIENLRKAAWYIDREIHRRTRAPSA